MRRVLLMLLAAGVALVAARAACRALASEESKIRWLVESMAAGFDDESAGRSVKGLAEDWRGQDEWLDKATLRALLARFFLEEREARTGEPRYRVELPPGELEVTWSRERPDAASLECLARFLDRRGGPERLAWEVAIEADLERREPGWRIVRTSHRTLGGERLGR